MQQITFRLNDATLARLDRLVRRGEYPTRSEAIRQYIREGVKADEGAEDQRPMPMGLPANGND
jgi:Arc/MetJ-type ribon-helix-helix transcriptional regulator